MKTLWEIGDKRGNGGHEVAWPLTPFHFSFLVCPIGGTVVAWQLGRLYINNGNGMEGSARRYGILAAAVELTEDPCNFKRSCISCRSSSRLCF